VAPSREPERHAWRGGDRLRRAEPEPVYVDHHRERHPVDPRAPRIQRAAVSEDLNMTAKVYDGECARCLEPLMPLIEPLSGRLIMYCSSCDESKVVERRAPPKAA
jgi:hypothetical protein